ncbi:MAG: biotin--[acetyl-CoA-carboxylase] ligase [Caldilineaceae bacterium]|nr:biotin--[acetyl-CoA-carboxylase] ligase [Caldilineaceae bacterium]
MNDPHPLFHPLRVEWVQQALQASPIGHKIIYHPQVTSTMPIAHGWVQQASTSADSAGVIIVAEEQTAGRGRLQRRWEAPPGRALLTSIIVTPPLLPVEPAQLSMIAGLAALETLRAAVPVLARHLWLKWPNDLLVVGDGVAGKLGGILIESKFGAGAIDHAVIGIGVNVNQRAGEMPPQPANGIGPASLYTLLGHEVLREDLLIGLCHRLSYWLEPSIRPSPEEIHRCWQAALINLGHTVIVRSASDSTSAWTIEGRAVDTTLTGSLIIEQVGGVRQVVEVGDAEFQWNRG